MSEKNRLAPIADTYKASETASPPEQRVPGVTTSNVHHLHQQPLQKREPAGAGRRLQRVPVGGHSAGREASKPCVAPVPPRRSRSVPPPTGQLLWKIP
ncbi:hypothetical protein SPI_04627 [Niveomyces insectorum RCEF 264]|uniref:Uncharacterized protein n=1 Tax=Niveomyces insectorum RCEF 264 TaxID=1081102 RepID=A0A167UPC4_9HYPO|nr:hypothetical protein SPI_04627 [Niveomyces insectorum RCEF 264]